MLDWKRKCFHFFFFFRLCSIKRILSFFFFVYFKLSVNVLSQVEDLFQNSFKQHLNLVWFVAGTSCFLATHEDKFFIGNIWARFIYSQYRDELKKKSCKWSIDQSRTMLTNDVINTRWRQQEVNGSDRNV